MNKLEYILNKSSFNDQEVFDKYMKRILTFNTKIRRNYDL